VHFWPGNALKVRTPEKLRLNAWTQIGVTCDGSSRAAGVKLFVDGRPAECDVVRDSLFKDFANGAPLTLAARFRGRGFKGGLIDSLKIFDRLLTRLEMAQVAGGDAAGLPAPAGDADAAGAREALFEAYMERVDAQAATLRSELKKARDQENQFINGIPELMAMGDLPTPRPTYILKRGAYDAHGDTVEPGTPESIFPMDPKYSRNRLGLAQWLVDPKNPLVSRV